MTSLNKQGAGGRTTAAELARQDQRCGKALQGFRRETDAAETEEATGGVSTEERCMYGKMREWKDKWLEREEDLNSFQAQEGRRTSSASTQAHNDKLAYR